MYSGSSRCVRALVLLDAELLEQAQYEIVGRVVGVDRGERAIEQLQARSR
jgi:hypothetical protein